MLVLGGPAHPTLEVEIYRRTAQLLDLPGAAAIAVVQLLAVATVLSSRPGSRRGSPSSSAAGRPGRCWDRSAARARVPSWRSCLVEIVLVAVPMVALVVRSLRVRDHWGLAWWRTLFAAPVTTRDVDIAASMRTSLGYAAATVVVAVVVGGLAASAVAYARRGGRALETWLMLPLGRRR